MRNPVMENLGIQERRIFISKMLCMTWLYSLRILNLIERGSGEVVDSVGFGRGRSCFGFSFSFCSCGGFDVWLLGGAIDCNASCLSVQLCVEREKEEE
jgi:hypothetical protein